MPPQLPAPGQAFFSIAVSSCSSILPVTKRAMAAGTKVTVSTSAQTSAVTTVKAMGWNIFPSTPVRLKMGR